MNPSSLYPNTRKKRPRFISMLAGFAISFVLGLLVGQVTSLFYAVLGQGGGLECIRYPLMLFIISISALVSFYATRLINRRWL